MISNIESPQDSDVAFFSSSYRDLSGWLRRFSQTYQIARQAHQLQACQELVDLADLILSRALSIVSDQPSTAAFDVVTPSVFIDKLTRLQLALSSSANPSYSSIAPLLDQHISYASANLAPNSAGVLLYDDTNSAILRDCSVACVQIITERLFNLFQWSCPDPRETRTFFHTDSISDSITPRSLQILESVKQLQGWCSDQKAALLYSLVRDYKPTTAVEIGIYGGRSIVPIASAIKDNSHGSVYGIETWSGAAATTYRTNFANDFWWMNIDFIQIKADFYKYISQYELHDVIRVIEAPSEKCGSLFDCIDFLHIDGGHSTYGAAQDVVNYVAKVPSGGIIVYDDINWPSTAAGLDILRDCCQLLHVVTAYGSETEPGCAAFRKI